MNFNNKFDENTRVKFPAILHFLKIGYNYLSLEKSNIDSKTKIFVDIFKKSISKINGIDYTIEDIYKIINDINEILKNNDLGKSFYNWLIKPGDNIKLIDFETIENNDFSIVSEFPFTTNNDTETSSFRPDITILINGIPISFLEVKIPNNSGGIQSEFKRMINDRLNENIFNKFFNMIQIVSFSNNMEYDTNCQSISSIKSGSFYTTLNGKFTSFSLFREEDKMFHNNYNYKVLSEEIKSTIIKDNKYNESILDTQEFSYNDNVFSPCNKFITSLYDKERFLFLIKFGIVYVDDKIPQKHIMRYPQFFASRNIVKRLNSGSKRGIIWHTQGSGKTALASFACNILKDYFSKKGINTRFYFVVDRLELLSQASYEFKSRGMHVTNCDSKKSFSDEINKIFSTNLSDESSIEICVVNIHKFESEIPETKNIYNSKIQRIFFIDEAHRSYQKNGEFLSNLINCDRDAIFIALTGTPILTECERTNLKFGNYIHTYFYDKSIADGYTLKIKKEEIETSAYINIKKNIKFEQTKMSINELYESKSYIDALCDYINTNFAFFRKTNNDNTLGGMIVCRSNNQARKIYEWFKEKSNFKTGLVICDYGDNRQKEENKINQTKFREQHELDILVVNMMLTTGFDVKRLKKMYLLRGPHSQSLLQTISRVNRPYRNPVNNNEYSYGYIVDFAGIEDEYQKTIAEYRRELAEEFIEDCPDCIDDIILDVEEIYSKYIKIIKNLSYSFTISNLEKFSKEIETLDITKLFELKNDFDLIRDCEKEFKLSEHKKYYDKEKVSNHKRMLNIVKRRINFLKLNSNPIVNMNLFSNDELFEIIYEFNFMRSSTLNLENNNKNNENVAEILESLMEIKNKLSIVSEIDNPKIIELEEFLRKILKKLSIVDNKEIESVKSDLEECKKKIKIIKDEFSEINKEFNGYIFFTKTFYELQKDLLDIRVDDIKLILLKILEQYRTDFENKNIFKLDKQSFEESIKEHISKKIYSIGLYDKIKKHYNYIISTLYKNMQIYN